MTRGEAIAGRLVECGLLDTGKPEALAKILTALDSGRIVIIANNTNQKLKQWVGAFNSGQKLADVFTPDQITECKLS